jgi:4-hydroxy-3-polyprenylbenzoate decarboxylase
MLQSSESAILEWMYKNLQAFIRELERRQELVRVKESVSSELEITEIADRMVKSGGPALLFETVQDRDFPVFIGGYGTAERTAVAMGVKSLDDLAIRVASLMKLNPGKGGLKAAFALLPKLRELKGFFPKKVRGGPVQEVVLRGEQVNLGRIPILKCWPLDGGPFITLPLVITRDPESGELNLGMYRMQVLDKQSTAMHWQLHKVGRRHYDKAKKLGKRLEIAVAIGGDPILTYAATAPVPPIPGVNEFNLAGFLRGRPVELTPGITVDLPVPAEAEFILEGYVDPAEELVVEGPFGDHTGFYTLEEPYPRFHVTAITHRKNAVYPATIVGRPPMEDAYLIEASERLFLPAAQLILPEIHDYHMPPAGVAHNWVNVGIEKRYPGQGYKVANGLFGLGQMMFAKVMVVLDAGAPLKGPASLQAALERALPGRDTLVSRGPIDVLDHSSRAMGFGGKLIIDGTTKLEEEGGTLPFALQAHASLPGIPGVQQKQLPGIWMVTLEKTHPHQAREIAERLRVAPHSAGIRLMLLTDSDTRLEFDEVMWAVLNNIDPERDAWVMQAVEGPLLVLDGTRKLAEEGFNRRWPPKILMSPAMVERVDERWHRLGLPALPPKGTTVVARD